MIRIVVRHSKGDVSVAVVGHADAGEPGHDIICAGVSAIVQTAILGLEEIAAQYPQHVSCEIDGQLSVMLGHEASEAREPRAT